MTNNHRPAKGHDQRLRLCNTQRRWPVARPLSFNLLLGVLLLAVFESSSAALASSLVGNNGTEPSALTKAPALYRGFAAICAVAKNENRYVREWVDYHKCLGFSRIYLYDHGSKERMSEQLEEQVASGFVSYNYFTGHHKKYSRSARPTSLDKFLLTAQGYAYKKCVKHHSKQHSFLGFIDIDEFLVLTDPGITNVEQLLRPYSGFGGLAVHWQLVGSSNRTKRPDGPVTTSYTHCVKPEAMENRQFKVFANTAARPVMQNPHRPRLFAPQNLPFPYLVNEQRKRIRSGSEDNHPTHTKAAVMHYVIKSREDYEEKLVRGGGAGVKRRDGYYEFMEHKARHPCPVSPAELQQRLCPASGARARGQ